MPWKYILSIRFNDNVVYKREINEKEIYVVNNEEKLLDKNTIDREILSNMEVVK